MPKPGNSGSLVARVRKPGCYLQCPGLLVARVLKPGYQSQEPALPKDDIQTLFAVHALVSSLKIYILLYSCASKQTCSIRYDAYLQLYIFDLDAPETSVFKTSKQHKKSAIEGGRLLQQCFHLLYRCFLGIQNEKYRLASYLMELLRFEAHLCNQISITPP